MFLDSPKVEKSQCLALQSIPVLRVLLFELLLRGLSIAAD
jgi:hypothetical protein